MGIIPTPHRAVKKIKRSNSGNICLVPQTWLTKCYFSLAVSLGTEVWPAKRSDGRQIFHVLWVTTGEVRQPFYPGKPHHQRTWKLPSFLAAQRKAFNFSYFYPGNHNLHLQENEGVIFLLPRHLGWFIAALGVVNGSWSSSGFWRQAGPHQGPGWLPGVIATCLACYELTGFSIELSARLYFHFLGRESEVTGNVEALLVEGPMHLMSLVFASDHRLKWECFLPGLGCDSTV